MVIVLVTFPVSGHVPADAEQLLRKTAPGYRDIDGLHRKYFIGNESIAGGVYEWVDRETAEAFYDAAWKEKMWTRYAVKPELQFFNAPCLVDNIVGDTIFDC